MKATFALKHTWYFFKPDMSQVMSDRGWGLLDEEWMMGFAGRKGGLGEWYSMSFGDR